MAILSTLVGAVPGAALAFAAALTARVRGTKPLHPVGVVGDGILRVEGAARTGVPLLDDAADHAVTVRWSRAIGSKPTSSDIEGLALRLTIDGRPADVLFASTGSGIVTRHLLAVRRPGRYGVMSTLLPVATDKGPLLLRVEPDDGPGLPVAYAVSWSRPGGRWQSLGSLSIQWGGSDRPLRFDPVLNPLPGTSQYRVVRSLREPAYGTARRTASEEGELPAN